MRALGLGLTNSSCLFAYQPLILSMSFSSGTTSLRLEESPKRSRSSRRRITTGFSLASNILESKGAMQKGVEIIKISSFALLSCSRTRLKALLLLERLFLRLLIPSNSSLRFPSLLRLLHFKRRPQSKAIRSKLTS